MGRVIGTRFVLPLAIIGFVTVFGCDDDPTTLPSTPDRYVEPTSPENVLANLVAAHARVDLEAYGATLADEFVFYPSSRNRVRFHHLSKERDEATMATLFAEVVTVDILLTSGSAVPSELDEFPAADGFMQIDATAVVNAIMGWTDQGTPLGYSTPPAEATFVFEPDSSVSPPTWSVRYQADHGGRGSWASIKGLFLQPVQYLPPTSPDNVLGNLVTAHREFDITGYRDLKAVDFRFVPSPTDTLPFQSLDRVEDDQVTSRMFGTAERIEIDLTHGGSTPSDREEFPASQGYRQIEAIAMLRVTDDASSEEPLILLVDDDPATFVFEPDSSVTPVSWKVVLQEDGGSLRGRSPRVLPIEVTSWGGLKAMWR